MASGFGRNFCRGNFCRRNFFRKASRWHLTVRILIVGTAFPLRGGIAHYVSLLYKTLVERGHDVRIISFSRQYPKLLFPGKTQDEAGETTIPLASEPVIDSVNPLTWIKAGKLAASYAPDLLIFKFWLPFFAPAYGVIARTAKRITRKMGKECKVIFIADNVIPHEKRPGDRAFTKFAFKYVDWFIVQSDAVERDLLTVSPKAKYIKLPHPIYEIFGAREDRSNVRKQLGISDDAPAILFFGYIRKYKGLDILLRAMPALIEKLPEIRLIVAGEFYGDREEYESLIKELKIPAKNLVLATDYIANEEVAKYFTASNVVVLPYRSATQSGIVQIAYNFDVPVISTDVGGLAEVVIDGKCGIVVERAEPALIAEAVLKFFSESLEQKFTEGVRDEKKKYSWAGFVEGIEQVMKR
jgi:D-inositol-3-phosphate glycosyltransferase